MTWFKVDDSFHSHPKVLATGADALGLWVIAGSWSSSNLTDGFVPDHVLPRLLPGSEVLARTLVTARLWNRVRGGYQFHDWEDFNPAAKTVQREREAARERMRVVRARRKESGTSDQRRGIENKPNRSRENEEEQTSGDGSPGQGTNGSPEQQANVRAKFGNPDPTRKYLGGDLSEPVTHARAHPRARGQDPPPEPRCEKHKDQPSDDPCRRCGEARRNRAQWDRDDAERRRLAPKCRSHRGQPADNCALCRSEDLADDKGPGPETRTDEKDSTP